MQPEYPCVALYKLMSKDEHRYCSFDNKMNPLERAMVGCQRAEVAVMLQYERERESCNKRMACELTRVSTVKSHRTDSMLL